MACPASDRSISVGLDGWYAGATGGACGFSFTHHHICSVVSGSANSIWLVRAISFFFFLPFPFPCACSLHVLMTRHASFSNRKGEAQLDSRGVIRRRLHARRNERSEASWVGGGAELRMGWVGVEEPIAVACGCRFHFSATATTLLEMLSREEESARRETWNLLCDQ